jgi:hypothetical protein
MSVDDAVVLSMGKTRGAVRAGADGGDDYARRRERERERVE